MKTTIPVVPNATKPATTLLAAILDDTGSTNTTVLLLDVGSILSEGLWLIVGETDGSEEGEEVGEIEGLEEGLDDGTEVGLALPVIVGLDEGLDDGTKEGLALWSMVGSDEGLDDGAKDGLALWSIVGSDEGKEDGGTDGVSDKDGVFDAIFVGCLLGIIDGEFDTVGDLVTSGSYGRNSIIRLPRSTTLYPIRSKAEHCTSCLSSSGLCPL